MRISSFLLLLALPLFGGCAHTIVVAPDFGHLPTAPKDATRMERPAGYVMSDADRKRIVNSGGGGGDSVSYTLYKDIESGFYHVLSNFFAHVYAMNRPDDAAFIKEKNIELIFVPIFTTQSSSSSLLTWPPTEFTLKIEINAVDLHGKTIWKQEVTGVGKAEFSEFKSEFGLAAKRAAEQALQKLDAALVQFPKD
jgi:hypothetical protein